ncbi:nucleotide-binding protein [Amycolatopsis sp. NPDC051102]|uniref:nucleotide-binding protein n=1 Tax=Amycolatopsis sp. NPDC051102 TaxID=3155163 RepID=UPI00342CDF81
MPNVTLVANPAEFRAQLERQQVAGKELLELPVGSSEELDNFKQAYFEWDDLNVALLEASFESSGWMTTTPVSDYRGTGMPVLDVKVSRASSGIAPDRLPAVIEDIKAKCGVLRSIHNRVDVYPRNREVHPEEIPASGQAIFIVHGHGLLAREQVRSFLQKVTSTAVIVLEDEANLGRDILGKLLDSAKLAKYAVVLLTADDEGRKIGEGQWNSRARQNVVLELGLFLGLLGRDKVAALYEEGVEIPSDYSGVLYISLGGEGWKLKLATELKNSGIDVDLNRAI